MRKFWVFDPVKRDAHGPYEIATLKSLPNFGPESLVAADGAASAEAWKPASAHAELRVLFGKPSPPPLPRAPVPPPVRPEPHAPMATAPSPVSASTGGGVAVKMVVYGLVAVGTVIGSAWFVMVKYAPPTAVAISPTAPPPAASKSVPISPSEDLPGYKDTRWGMAREAVAKTFHARLSKASVSLPDLWYMAPLFATLWASTADRAGPILENYTDVMPKGFIGLAQPPSYTSAISPEEATFLNGKLYAIHFTFQPEKQDEIVAALVAKHGKPAFDNPGLTISSRGRPSTLHVRGWPLGRTMILVVNWFWGDAAERYGHGDYVIYLSTEINAEITRDLEARWQQRAVGVSDRVP